MAFSGAPYARSMADLLLASGAARADAERRKGAVWGQTMASLSQIPAQIMGQRQYEQDRAQAVQDRESQRALRTAQIENLTRDDERLAASAELDQALKRLEIMGRTFGGVTDQASYDAALTRLSELGADLSTTPKTYSPGFVHARMLEAVSVKDQLEARRPQIAPSGSGIVQDGQITGQVPFAPRPLVGVGPENILTPPEEAVGQPGYRPPQPPEPLVGVGPENILTPHSQAAGQPGYRPPQPSPAQRFSSRLVMVDGKEVQANYDALTGKYHDIDTGNVLQGVQPAPTADMRNKTEGRKLVARSITTIEALSQKVITKRGIVQRATAAGRSVESALGNDPEYRTYQDARRALAGNLAVAQQGSRPSDADITAIWLPLVPDAFRDTDESALMKWTLIKTMSNQPTGASGEPAAQGPPAGTGVNPFRSGR